MAIAELLHVVVRAPMDWLQFTSGIVQALAWPLVVVAGLFLGRKHWGPLLRRLQELKVAGAHAIFREHLEAGKAQADELAPAPAHIRETAPDKAFLELAENFPAAAVTQSWKDVEGILKQVRERLPGMQRRHKLDSVVRRLREQEHIEPSAERLYQSLRDARNTAVHITSVEALDFREQVEVLSGLFRGALARLPQRAAIGLAKA
jgi:hypothetical protein